MVLTLVVHALNDVDVAIVVLRFVAVGADIAWGAHVFTAVLELSSR